MIVLVLVREDPVEMDIPNILNNCSGRSTGKPACRETPGQIADIPASLFCNGGILTHTFYESIICKYIYVWSVKIRFNVSKPPFEKYIYRFK